MAEPDFMTDEDIIAQLERRLGPIYARQRLGIERDHEARVFGDGLNSSMSRTGTPRPGWCETC
jgi:hypothetical protein